MLYPISLCLNLCIFYIIFIAGKQNFTVRIGGDVEAAKELVVHQDDVDDESDSERAEKNQDADNDVMCLNFK